MNALLLIAYFSLLSPGAWAIQAQPVPIPEDPSTAPQVEFSGVGIGTFDFRKTGEAGTGRAGVNFSDSAFFVGAAQKLYGDGVGSFGLGGLTTDDSVPGTSTSLFLNKAFVNFQAEKFEVTIGRSDNPTSHLVDFPTLRGDDLITLTNPMNPFSNGGNLEEHRYSNALSLTANQKLTYFENIHAQHLINSANIGTKSGINSIGASFGYLSELGLEAFQSVPSWGVGVEQIIIQAHSPDGLHQAYAGGILNLNESVTNRWDLRIQNIVSWGSRLTALQNSTDSYQANSNAASASLRYLSSPFGRPGYQLALTFAQKTYFDISNAASIGGALTGVKRLGQGFDLIAQYEAQWRGTALANVQSNGRSTEHIAEVGLSFNFDSIFNQHLSPRRTLLNQQHQFVPN